MRIQHNIMAMNAYRNYNTNTKALSGNLEKLSSGYKINRAGDDAAGLAISEKMRAQITGLDAAQKNVKDGISLVKTAEGAMQEIQDMLNRMEYLATQSANGTYQNAVDRENLQKEVDALTTEIDRIADSANFNGIKLLDGSLSSGGAANSDGSMSVNLKACGHYQLFQDGVDEQEPSFEINVKQFVNGLSATKSVAANATIGTVTMKVGGQDIQFSVVAKSAVAQGAAIDASKVTISCDKTSVSFSQNGVTMKMEITAPTGTDGTFSFAKAGSVANADFNANMDVSFSITGNAKLTKKGDGVENCKTQNVNNGVAMKNDQLAHGGFQLTSAIVKALEKGGVLTIGDKQIEFDPDSNNADTTDESVGIKDLLDGNGNLKTDDATMRLLATSITRAANSSTMFTVGVGADGKTITLQEKVGQHNDDDETTHLYTDEQFSKQVSYTGGGDDAGSEGALTLQIGDTGDSYNQMSVSIDDMHAAGLGLSNLSIATQDNAKQAIQTIKDAINKVSSTRGDLGAIQNRLDHTGNNLAVMAENIQDAESTIRDTDVADEMMKYVKNNILVQSAQAMLAQANQVPQGVLQLLG